MLLTSNAHMITSLSKNLAKKQIYEGQRRNKKEGIGNEYFIIHGVMAESCEDFAELSKKKNKQSFLGLPWQDVIFSHIFRYLSLSDISRCSRVSKLFCELCLNFFKVCHLLDCSMVANGGRRITETAFTRITLQSCHLKVLILENCKNICSDAALVLLFRRNPQLSCLDLSGCNGLTNKCLVDVGESCAKLNKIYLRECRWVSPAGVMSVALSCKLLQVVDLSGCWEVNDDCLTVLVKSCPEISELSVNGCYGITDHSLHIVSRHLPKLTRLELNGCWRVTNYAVQMVGEYCRELRWLRVKDCRDISDASLARLRVRGVDINVAAITAPSLILGGSFHKPANMHMTPCLRFNPS